MDRIHFSPLLPIGPYEDNRSWLDASAAHEAAERKPLSGFMARHQFARYAQEIYAQTAAQGIAGIIHNAKQIAAAAKVFLQPETSPLEGRIIETSDPSAVTAKAERGAPLHALDVRVEALAKEQINSGASFVRGSLTSIRSGPSEFDLLTNGRSTRVSVWITAGDTHEQALNKMRAAINAADSGVNARLQTDADGKITLELRGSETGKVHAFTIAGVTGNAVAATGSRLVSQPAQDAEYRIDDGPQHASPSNTVVLDESRLTLTFARPTDGQAVRVSVKPATGAVTAQVKLLTERYNELLGRVQEAGGYIHPALLRRVRGAVPAAGLDALGIERDESGRLQLDERALASRMSADFAGVRSALLEPYGLAARLEHLAGKLESSPAEALLDRGNREFMRYANYQATLRLYSQLPFEGRLLNRYF